MIEFIESAHVYLIDGVIAPSVSEILRKIYPDIYKNVPDYILNQKAEYGTALHKAIENYDNGEPIDDVTFYITESLKQYHQLVYETGYQNLQSEVLVNYYDWYCGRFDSLKTKDDQEFLCDIKTYANMNDEAIEKTTLQLSLYSLALDEETYSSRNLAIIWLPKGKLGKMIINTPLPLNELKQKIKGAVDEIKAEQGY